MEDSQPLRRSTRSSVVLKNEELTPRKRKVSTPVKVEPSTPSRRTRGSSATPKKNLIEVMNTPKKTLPVLNEEENAASSTHTPVKKSKEISPKTPRRRTVGESVSTPTRVSVDRSTKKSGDTEEINITANRPLTRAKRKTMVEIQAAEVTKTSEPEKVVQNKKDNKPESDKGVQNKKDKPSMKSASVSSKTNKSPNSKSDKKKDESSSALVPKVVPTDIVVEPFKEPKNVENVEENNCGMFTTKSPVRAEDVAINSPRKVPESCKSISESSLMSDSEYINSRSQKIAVDPENSIISAGITDISSEQVPCESPVNTNLAITSPQKATDSKDNGVPNIVITSPSPQKATDSKDNDVPNIIITSPSPQKATDSKNDIFTTSPSSKKVIDSKNIAVASPSPKKVTDSKNIAITSPSPKNVTDSKNDIVITSPPPQNVTDSKNNIAIISPSPQKTTDLKNDIAITSQSPKKVTDSKDNDRNDSDSSLTSEQKTSPRKNETNSSSILTDVKEKYTHEPSKSEISTSFNIDSESTNMPDQNEETIKLENQSSSPEKRTEEDIKPENQSSSPEKRTEEDSTSVSENIEQKIEVFENTQVKIDEKSNIEEVDKSNETIILDADVSKVSPTKTDFENKEFELILPCTGDEASSMDNDSSKKVDAVENVISNDTNEKNSVQTVMQVSSIEIPHIIQEIDMKMTQIENKELNKTFDKVDSNEHIPDSDEFITVKDFCAMKSTDQVLVDKNNVPEMVPDANEAITKDDVSPMENKYSQETNESKLNNTTDQAFNLMEVDTITSSTPVVKKQETEVEITQDEIIAVETIPSGPNNSSGSEFISTEVKDKKMDEIIPSMSKIPTEVNMIQINKKVDELLIGTTDKSSPVKPNGASSSKQPDLAENKSVTEKKVVEMHTGPAAEEYIENAHDSHSPSPIFYVKCDCETTDDSGDSGILNDDNVIILKMCSPFKKLITREKNLYSNISESDGEGSPEEASKLVTRAYEESSFKVTLDGGVTLERGPSGAKLSLGNPDSNVENDPNILLDVEDKTKTTAENIPKSLESTDDRNNKIAGLDAILMSPKDFLNSDEESNVDCEKIEDSQSICEKIQDSQSNDGKYSCDENKPSEEVTNTDIDHLEHSISETQDSNSLNVTVDSDPSSEDSSTNIDEKEDGRDVNDITEIVPTDSEIPEIVPIDSEIPEIVPTDSEIPEIVPTDPEIPEIVPTDSEIPDEVKDTCNDQEKEKDDESKNSSNNSSEGNQLCVNNSESLIANDETISLKPSDSIEENEIEVSNTQVNVNVQDSLNSSKNISSPEVQVEKSFEDDKSSNKSIELDFRLESSFNYSDSSEWDGQDIKKNIKYIKSRRKNVNKKFDSEKDSSQSDADSELSNYPPSNAATEGSSDGPLTGRDFIDFEAEEGEESSEDDSFIASSTDSSMSSSSDKPSFSKKLMKRKRYLDTESSVSGNYVDSVPKMFDNSTDPSKDNKQQDNSIKNKKLKLEKVSTVNKKNRSPKSILRIKPTVVDSTENRNRNKIETENKMIKESSKIGVFIVSSISQDCEEPKVSRNISKRNSKLSMEQKKLETSDNYKVPKGFSVSDAGDNVVDAALRGFAVSCNESSYLVTKKPRKAVDGCSELTSKKKKIKEGKNNKKIVKKFLNAESKGDDKSNKDSPFVVTLVLPVNMTSRSISSLLTDLGLSDISSINVPKRRVAIVEFSSEEPFKKILKLYGEVKINDKPIYVLEGSSLS